MKKQLLLVCRGFILLFLLFGISKAKAQPADASFTFSPDTVCEQQPVQFNCTGTGPACNVYDLHAWEFDTSGTVTSATSNSPNPQFSYPDTGTVVVEHYVENCIPGSCTEDTVYKTITINPTPEADFTASTECVGDSTEFTNNTSFKGDTLSYIWAFGDGDSSRKENPTHLYDSADTYSVTLTATSDSGCNDQITKPVEVIDDPDAAFTVDNVCDGTAADFQNNSSPSGGLNYEWRFGDGTTSSNPAPSHTYPDTGTYDVTLIVTAGTSCSDTATGTVTVNPEPQAGFTATGECLGDTTKFTNNTTFKGDTLSYIWAFGDGDSSTMENPDHLYDTSGTFSVTLRAVSDSGCVDEVTKSVTVDTKPDAAFSVDNVCDGTPADFQNNTTVTTGVLSYVWDFGDGSTSSNPDPTHLYQDTGTYTVTLIAETNNGCKDTATGQVVVNPEPQADFTATSECLGDTTMFTNNTSFKGDTLNYVWAFGNGDSSTMESPEYLYDTSGTFDVTLTAVSDSGCVDQQTKQVTVSPEPDAAFTTSDVCGDSTSVSFTNQSTATVNMSYDWQFGDGETSSNPDPSHVYGDTGTYEVVLIVSTNSNCKDTARETVIVNPEPDVSFTATTVCKGDSTIFTNNTSFKGDTLSYLWTFGDGDSSMMKNPKHLYDTSGVFDVTLVAVSDSGCVDQQTKQVTVEAEPEAAFTAPNVCEGSPVPFTNQSTVKVGVMSFDWDFGDGSTSTSTNPSYTYGDTGTYTVTLVAETNAGCSDTAVNQITVNPQPEAAFTATTECKGDSTVFTNNTTFKGDTLSYIWDFDDGDSVTAKNPKHLYDTSGNYNVTLTVVSDSGCVDQVTNQVTVESEPVAAFSAPNVCDGTSVSFTNQSTLGVGVMNFEWDFGDGTSTTTSSPTHAYSDTGTYTVTLVAETNAGCTDTAINTVTVNPEPQVSLSANNVCDGDTMMFTNKTTFKGDTLDYIWDFGDGDSSTAESPMHLYDTLGTYTVILTAISDSGCIDQDSISVDVYPEPMADFSADNVCEGTAVVFNNQSTVPQGNISYEWYFGDTTSSFNPNPTHLYGDTGTYTVTLVVSTNNGCTDTSIQDVVVNPEPDADFTTMDVCQGDTTFFMDSTSFKGDKDSLTYVWDFDDGDSSMMQNPAHLYDTIGDYNVTLTVISDSGCIDQHTETVQVDPEPTADFTALDVCEGDSVIFQNNSTVPVGVLNYEWFFGDSTKSFNPNPTHTYADTGTYTVTLVAFSNDGCTDTFRQDVTVFPKPDAGFTAENVCDGTPVNFTNTSTIKGGNMSYIWDFGDGDSSMMENPTYEYDTFGTYTVTLTAISDSGCVGKFTDEVEVYPEPKAAFQADNVCDGKPVEFNNNSSIPVGVNNYNWDFDDGDGSVANEPDHLYDAPGTYNVTLVATSDNGCTDSVTSSVRVYPVPEAGFEVDNVCDGDTVVFNDTSSILSGSLSYHWDFDYQPSLAPDTINTSTEANPTWVYDEPGFYRVYQNVTSDKGCVDTARNNLYVHALPEIDAGKDTTISYGYSTVLEAESNRNDNNADFFWEPNESLSSPMVLQPTAQPFEDTEYQITVTDSNGCVSKDEVFVKVVKDYVFDVNNAFSPNGDGVNDEFVVGNARNYDDFEIRIYNRWGNLVYQSDNYQNDWDGTSSNGEELPDGTYYYVIRFDGSDKLFKGSVSILR
ncbi:MAG: hypothetical protein BRD50_02570 [Bacteroidetes bacterium SW_11_45_7]|nr:MAG: hypothetical protein BRD50_02570 [Bacteroidetes bacterium SW_11_45_7]